MFARIFETHIHSRDPHLSRHIGVCIRVDPDIVGREISCEIDVLTMQHIHQQSAVVLLENGLDRRGIRGHGVSDVLSSEDLSWSQVEESLGVG